MKELRRCNELLFLLKNLFLEFIKHTFHRIDIEGDAVSREHHQDVADFIFNAAFFLRMVTNPLGLLFNVRIGQFADFADEKQERLRIIRHGQTAEFVIVFDNIDYFLHNTSLRWLKILFPILPYEMRVWSGVFFLHLTQYV